MKIHGKKQEKYAIIAALLWGANYPTVKLVLRVIPENLFLLIRFSVSVALLCGCLYVCKENIKVQKKHLLHFLVLGILGVGLYNIIWTAGIHRTTAANAALLISTAPIFTGLYALLTRKEDLNWRYCLGILLALSGIILITAWKPGARFSIEGATMTGNLLVLAGAVLFSFYAIVAKPLLSEYSPLKVTTLAMAFGLPVLIPYGFIGLTELDPGSVDMQIGLELTFVIVCGTVLAYVFWYQGIKQLGPTRTVVFHYLVSVISMMVGSLVLAEKITAGQIAGAVLVLAGLILSQRHSSGVSPIVKSLARQYSLTNSKRKSGETMFENIEEVRSIRKKYNHKMFTSGVSTFREFEELEAKTLQSGALERKYKELIGLATSIVSLCYGCVEYHTTQAIANGASRQEIAETVALALMMGGGPAQWPGRYVFKVLDELEGESKNS